MLKETKKGLMIVIWVLLVACFGLSKVIGISEGLVQLMRKLVTTNLLCEDLSDMRRISACLLCQRLWQTEKFYIS